MKGVALSLCLVASPALAGPITSSAFTDLPLPSWVAPFVPGDALTLNGAFRFTDEPWITIAEHEECGENRVTTVGAPTLDEPTAVAFAYQVGDGTIWLSTENTLHFTLFSDEDGYWVAMTEDCDEATPPAGPPGEVTGDGEPRPFVPAPPTIRVRHNYVLLFAGTTPPRPPSSVPEPSTLGLVATGLIALWRRRQENGTNVH